MRRHREPTRRTAVRSWYLVILGWEEYVPNSLSTDQIRQLARRGAELRLEEVRREIAAISALLATGTRGQRRGPTGDRDSSDGHRPSRTTISAAGRAAIAAAQKARWAKIRAEANASAPSDGATSSTKPQRKRRRMSPAARKAAADRMRKYWAGRKAGAKK